MIINNGGTGLKSIKGDLTELIKVVNDLRTDYEDKIKTLDEKLKEIEALHAEMKILIDQIINN